ncbi:MAG: helix-hairpin-helix domain-containing protein [Bacteroidales bacterium]|nr:helix-hairpin-helix domain-containing protein [Bacteroidales bacterium]
MKRTFAGTAVATALLLLGAVSHAQSRDLGLEQSTIGIMTILGVDSPEDLDESEVESLSAYLDSPLEINAATASRLVGSGLFTPYRAASLTDYRLRHGDVLSLAELSAVDGFSEEFVMALAPFISLRSSALAGRTTERTSSVRNFLTARGAVRRYGSEDEYCYGVKYRLEIDDRFQLGLSANRTYGTSSPRPDGGSFYLAYYGDGKLGKIVLGDYRLRFGQGLALWSGFRMDSLSSPDAFCMRSGGISPYWSFTGEDSYRGVAADFNVGRFTFSTAVALNGLRKLMDGDKDADLSLMPALNVGWYGRRIRIGVTGYCTTATLNGIFDRYVSSDGGKVRVNEFWSKPLSSAGCSADFRWCPGGTDVFGEVAADLMTMKIKGLLGTAFRLSDQARMAVKTCCAEDEYKVSAVGNLHAGKYVSLAGRSGFGSSRRRHTGSLGAEMSWFPGKKYGAEGPNYQLKANANYILQASSCMSVALRYALRLRSAGEKLRNDIRCDVGYSDGPWSATCRLNVVYNTGLGLLTYIDGGWNSGRMSMSLRAGAFRIDNWADRIYVYERDAPGNFNVPAYYGRGVWGAFTAGVRVARQCRIYLRLSTLQYPWTSPTASVRTPKTEGKLMVVVDL